MKARSTLSLLIEMQRRERDRVAGLAAQAQRDVDAAAGTLRMLNEYRNDYEARSPKAHRAPTDTLRVQVHEAFVGKLGRAIGEQDTLLEHLSQRNDAQRLALVERQRRVKALETLDERREAARRKRLDALEQKQTDEFAAQAHARASRQEDDHD